MKVIVRCPKCNKELEIALPQDTRLKIIDVLYGGMSIVDFANWVKERLVIKEKD